MMEERYAAIPNHPNVFIPFLPKMKGIFFMGAAASALMIACTPPPPTSRIPSTEIPQPNPPLVLPPFQMDTSRSIDRVPPFQQTPLIAWGPVPDGVAHPERVRTYDLQHQVTTVRFDWSRQAVVGTTTLTVEGLPDDARLGGRVHVHRVGAHAAEPDDLAVLQALDDGGRDAAVPRDQGVGVLREGDELLLSLGRHLHDLGTDGIQRLALDRVGALGEVKADTARRLLDDDLELSFCGWHA